MFLQELRLGIRRLAKTPGFTLIAVLTLAVGIAANSAIFSVINGLFFHPAGISDPGRLLAVRVKYDTLNLKSIEVSLPDFANVRDSKQVFCSAAVAVAADYNYVGNGLPERLQGANVSWQWLQTFGDRPILGQDFRPEQDQPGGNHEVILSYDTWQRLFGGDPVIVGQSLADFEFLKEGGRSNSAGRGRQRLRSALVVGEVGLALVLLVGAGLFLRSLQHLQEVNPGFEPHGLMSAQVSLSPSSYSDAGRRIAFFRQVTEHLSQAPGVESAAAVDGLPFSDSGDASSFEIEGRSVAPGDPGPHSNIERVTPGYFSAMHIPLLSGRDFSDQDRPGGPPAVIIDANLARQYWPNQNPVGQRIRYNSLSAGTAWATIIGVVAHGKRSALVGESGTGMRYYSLLQTGAPSGFLVARTSGDPAALATTIRQSVKNVEPSQASAYDLQTMEQRVAESLGPRRFAVTLLGVFAAIALLLAALGLYGIISYSVALRTQEIGIRMALGARRLEVLSMVVGQGLRLVAAGAVAGLVVAFALGEALSSQLFEVSVFDPVTLGLMVIVMVAVAVLASYVPARRLTWIPWWRCDTSRFHILYAASLSSSLPRAANNSRELKGL